MIEAIVVVIVLMGIVFQVGRVFYNDNRLDKQGVATTAVILESRQDSANNDGSINGVFLISFKNERGEDEMTQFEETIQQLYASRVQPGETVDIKYLRQGKKLQVSFVFRRSVKGHPQ